MVVRASIEFFFLVIAGDSIDVVELYLTETSVPSNWSFREKIYE